MGSIRKIIFSDVFVYMLRKIKKEPHTVQPLIPSFFCSFRFTFFTLLYLLLEKLK